MKILTFHSYPPNNPFAPTWDYLMCQVQLHDPQMMDELKRLVLRKEKEILAQYPDAFNDGGTGLGKNDLTTKFAEFNVFSWQEEPAVKFTEFVKEQHARYLEALGFDRVTVYGKCWANVLRRGQEIKMHWHSCNPDSYLSGHFTVATNNTSTYYQNPYNSKDVHQERNVEGLLTFFPSYIRHWTDKHDGNDERITLAFDLYTFGNDVDKGWGQFKDKVEFSYRGKHEKIH